MQFDPGDYLKEEMVYDPWAEVYDSSRCTVWYRTEGRVLDRVEDVVGDTVWSAVMVEVRDGL